MFFVEILGKLMKVLYNICGNYGLSIILFTLISKIILLPISIWVQKNSIKMVKMQPDINKIKIKYFGDKDRIAEETSKLYKKEKYNALVSLIPLIIQIILLLCLVEVINKPLTYILEVPDDIIEEYKDIYVNDSNIEKNNSYIELQIVKDFKENNIEKYLIINKYNDYEKVNKEISQFNLMFLGVDLSWIAQITSGISFIIPIIAGLSALVMCIAQNRMNILQMEQTKISKWGMAIFSVGLSLYLGYFVSAGVALYWTFGNLFAVLQQYLLNLILNPKKYVNFNELERTQAELKELSALDSKRKKTKEQAKREREDYKRFFKVANKHLVFYAESNGFYKYFKGIIEYILEHTNIIIHYITSDYNDNIFNLANNNSQIKAYYIEEKKLITLMMKMDADVVVMTMPDLDNYHIKKSYVRDDITYIYIPHGLDSLNLTQRYKSINSYDVFFACGKYQRLEAEKTYELFKIQREIFDYGYTLLDDMMDDYKKKNIKKKESKTKYILIAPSWQKDNICDLCLEQILDNLKNNKNYKIVVRPHPQEVKHSKEKFEKLREKYSTKENIIIETDFSSNSSLLEASILITDWSGIAYEYAFTTKKPVLFIDTPMKVMNENYRDINIEPFNIWTRNVIGKSVKVDELDRIDEIIEMMFNNKNKYEKDITNLLNDSIYNLGLSSEKGAKYIIDCIKKKIQERSKRNENN